jgi:predicted nucleic acid-binding protein
VARRLILDTGVLIAAERSRSKLTEMIDEDDDVAIAAITVAELRTGVELASDRFRDRRATFVQRVMEVLPVEPYDVEAAVAHAVLLAHVQQTGVTRSAHDLIVAATALATGRTIVSSDRRARFHDLPGVSCLSY